MSFWEINSLRYLWSTAIQYEMLKLYSFVKLQFQNDCLSGYLVANIFLLSKLPCNFFCTLCSIFCWKHKRIQYMTCDQEKKTKGILSNFYKLTAQFPESFGILLWWDKTVGRWKFTAAGVKTKFYDTITYANISKDIGCQFWYIVIMTQPV